MSPRARRRESDPLPDEPGAPEPVESAVAAAVNHRQFIEWMMPPGRALTPEILAELPHDVLVNAIRDYQATREHQAHRELPSFDWAIKFLSGQTAKEIGAEAGRTRGGIYTAIGSLARSLSLLEH